MVCDCMYKHNAAAAAAIAGDCAFNGAATAPAARTPRYLPEHHRKSRRRKAKERRREDDH